MRPDARVAAFLEAGAWAGADPVPLAGDASARRYTRVRTPRGGPAVLMDAPPDSGEDTRPFIDVTARLRAAGYSAPALFQADPDRGLLLIEDLGDALYARVLEAGAADEMELYGAAIDLLADLHARKDAVVGLPPYDAAALIAEAALAPDWYRAHASAAPLPLAARDAFDALIRDLAGALAPHDPVCVLRDYHAENLLWLPDRAGHARVGLLDYQDALAGHPAYDVASLLEDARRDTMPALRAAMTDRYIAAAGVDARDFGADLARLAAQRNLKIIGIFARLCRRDGKPAYLQLIPRVWAHLQRDLAHPALADLRAWVAAHLPAPTAAVLERLARA